MHSSSRLHLAMTLAVVASFPACQCQRQAAIETPIAELQPCEENERCETGLCDSANGNPKACLRTCVQGCRGADICTRLESGEYACVPERAGLCKPCQSDSDCPQVADRCLSLGDQTYCGRDCSFDDQCPSGFRCGEATTVSGTLAPKQCQPSSGTCDCIPATAGQQIPCQVTNASGTCSGISVCRPPVGYDTCTARTPTAEVCNDIDDDCNGMTDENLGDLTCGVGDCVRAVAACANGTTQVCTPGLPGSETCNGRDDNCNGTVDDGFNLQTDVANCGACGTVCVLTNAVPICTAGACAVERCTPGWTDLDRVAANGCEYPCMPTDGGMEVCDGLDNDCDGVVDDGFDLINDPLNCGQCNLACSVPGTTVSSYACVARVCGIGLCVPGRGNCNQQYGDGCEVDLGTEVNHCGTCGNACTTANGTPGCDGGMCNVAQCNTGFADCDLQVQNGCEVNTQNSVIHCGACGNACDAANATDSCVNGSCAFACATNWWDADGQAANGCEYACIRTAGGVEQCDGIDNDCDNRIDEDFDLTSNSSHCGQCNRACSAPFATTACSASNCAVTACDTGRANCNAAYVDGCEVNTGTDVANCGSCNNTCSAANGTPRCAGGTCGIQSCNAGFENCNNQVADGCEVNTNTSLTNCGSCGNTCSAANGSPTCLGGSCGVASCNAGFANCNNLASDGCEVNTGTDLNNCGTCGALCSPAHSTARCASGACGFSSCDQGYTNCNGTVSDGCEVLTGGSDLQNCGGCGTLCSTANATPQCTTGTCGIQSCNLGFANCNNQVNDGCEINTNTSLTNCGACNNTCSANNGTPSCVGGACGVASCNAGFANCNGQAGDGCEVNTGNDLNNCGACNVQCSAANGTPSCVAGACGISSCNPGFTNCNGLVSDGCEVQTGGSDVANCGGCGTVCSVANGSPRCTLGACGIDSCNLGFANCNGQLNDGCEVNTNTTVTHCGTCGNACSAANGTASCVGGACGVASCNAGFANCNGSPSDGCEVNTTTSLTNCGACNVMCTAANGSPSCTSGSCGIASCNPGFTNCNGQVSDGCEVQTGGSDLANCGGCGTACSTPNATPVCTTGTCGISSCNLGFANCNGQVNDGCEVNTTNTIAHCGACGAQCAPANASPVCVAGSCGIGSCLPGFVNVNGLIADGCEYACLPTNGGVEACDGVDNDCDGAIDENFTLATDVNNCGSCGLVCAAPNVTVAQCNAGACGVQQCANGTANCNGTFSDGCEINTNTSTSHCGACGNVCSVSNGTPACVTGTCTIGSCSGSNRDCNTTYADGCETNVAGNVNACGVCGNVCPARTNASRTCSGTTCGYACNPGFVDLDGSAGNGCEYACTASGNDDPDDGSADQDCDGIDGSVSKGIFVSLTGSDANPGTRVLPKRTVQAAINAASSLQPHVYVSTGTYDEAISLRSGISVFGGYSPTTWARSSANVVTIRNGAISGSNIIAMRGTNITAATTVAYVTVSALSTSSPGVSVYGLHCNNCTGLTVRTALIMAGSAGSGTTGASGSAGASGFSGNGGAGGSCDGAAGGGGTGGASSCGRTGGNGGAGGPEGPNNGFTGGTGVSGIPGGAGGQGGGNNCNIFCGSCDPITGGGNGTSGGAGANGSNGGGGAGGFISATFFVTNGGGTGGAATPGNGGGGGGGGGGQGGNCNNDGGGNGGGGGGAGGCAGTAATGGTGGGSSFGVFLLNSTGAVFIGNTISSANGGNGGAGGTGGNGGSGGFGGAGAAVCTGEVGRGGNGGNGGAGGRGGHGGGGAGGLSYGIYRSGSTVTLTGNTVTNGNGGFGGASSGLVGSNGAQGTIF